MSAEIFLFFKVTFLKWQTYILDHEGTGSLSDAPCPVSHMVSTLVFQPSSVTTVTRNIRPAISPSTASFPTRRRTLRKRSPNFTKSTSKRDVSVKYFTVRFNRVSAQNKDSQLNTHTHRSVFEETRRFIVCGSLRYSLSLSLSGLTPAQSEFNYLNAARTLELYGMELHYARVSIAFLSRTTILI